MTWVVAHANPIIVVMMSDIRISVRYGATTAEISEFGVKKIHHVAPTVFAGFAGSIVLGFRLVNDLGRHLDEVFDPNLSTIDLVRGWASRLPRRIGPLVPPELAQARTDLIVAGMHLAPVNSAHGAAIGERMPYGSGCRVRLLEPATGDADVEPFSWRSAGVSVGSGATVPQYERMLAELDWVHLSQWDDPAEVMTGIMNMTIESAPTSSVSTDLITTIMRYGPDGIIGSGRTWGAMASDRSLIAEDEGDLYELWKRFELQGSAVTALSAIPAGY